MYILFSLIVLIAIYVLLRRFYPYKWINLIFIPIILLTLYLIYDYFYEEKLKANMVSVSRKLGEGITESELKTIEDITKNCKSCAKSCLKDIILAQDFTKQTGNPALESYFKDKIKNLM